MNDKMDEMDAAAKLAAKELKKILTAQQLADWIREWRLRADYGCLCTMILRVFPPVQ